MFKLGSLSNRLKSEYESEFYCWYLDISNNTSGNPWLQVEGHIIVSFGSEGKGHTDETPNGKKLLKSKFKIWYSYGDKDRNPSTVSKIRDTWQV